MLAIAVETPLPSVAPATPTPVRSGDRAHLHRPGTDVDSDSLSGNSASGIYVLRGNVTLHSDPKVDRVVAAETESDDPLTITADEIDVDRNGYTYVAKGHVRFTQGTRTGSSDLAMLDEIGHTLDLIGDADIRDGDRRAQAEKLHYDTQSKAFLGAGNVRIFQPLATPKPRGSASPAPKHKIHLPF